MANCYSVIIMYKQEEETLASICIPIHAADYQLLYDLLTAVVNKQSIMICKNKIPI